MNFIQKKLWMPWAPLLLILSVLAALILAFTPYRIQASNFLFLCGLFLLCVAIVDILLHAHLMAGWFQKQRKGESDEAFKKRKIDIKSVASKQKNEPIHFKKLSFTCTLIGGLMILEAIAMTI